MSAAAGWLRAGLGAFVGQRELGLLEPSLEALRMQRVLSAEVPT
jgi:hypothetical protein